MIKFLIKIIVLIIIILTIVLTVRYGKQDTTPEIPKEAEPVKEIIVPAKLLTISPEIILPGDPIMITNLASSSVAKITFDGKEVPVVVFENKSRAFIPIDFNEKDLDHQAQITLSNGMVIVEPIMITTREKIERPLGIPEKLGGNTPEAEKALVNNLAKENATLNTVKTEPKQLWAEKFSFPLENIFITDDYGYDRKTVNSIIVHKGTDFRAAEGTEVKALNDGIVRVTRKFTVYGNSVIIDHGLGVQSLYMHLSKIDVKDGDTVKAGQIIGKSGKTGYAEAAHLHISIKIRGISIDPMTFLGFFNVI